MTRLLVLGALLGLLVACAPGRSEPAVATRPIATSQPGAPTPAGPQGDGPATIDIENGRDVPTEPLPEGLRVETVAAGAQGLRFPVAIAFLPDGRYLVTEKGDGSPNDSVIHLFSAAGQPQAQPFATIRVDSFFERGLLGVAVDPDFAESHAVYVFYSAPVDPAVNIVARYTERAGQGVDPQVIFEAPVITGRGNHNGGNVHFGPDGKLYVTIGENADPALARDPQGRYGKIHRLNADGSVPADNPLLPGSALAYGLRNSFDFTFDPRTGSLWAAENGPGCDDEVNVIRPGGDYGWGPGADCAAPPAGSIPPALRWRETDALTGIVFYDGAAIPAWQGSLLICGYNSGLLYRATLTPSRDAVAALSRVELPAEAACTTDVEVGPDGAIYLLGRGSIFRLSAE
jgi:glucose/arabinose dehydrogenase